MAKYYKMSKDQFIAVFTQRQRRRKQMQTPAYARFFRKVVE